MRIHTVKRAGVMLPAAIWAEPRPGGGSRFCFTLPAERR
jgi:signal transduction histidine kinase